MQDILEIIKNVDSIYHSHDSLNLLKDYERVFDELDLYVFENWRDGELVKGPIVERHWITCSFMWPEEKMPNPEAAKRLSEYGCSVKYLRDTMVVPRKIKTPDDVRPGTRKGKLDEFPIWIVEVTMPKKLVLEIFRGYHNRMMSEIEEVTKASELQTPNEGEMVQKLDEPGAEQGAPNAA
jgi:hypothetical protein